MHAIQFQVSAACAIFALNAVLSNISLIQVRGSGRYEAAVQVVAEDTAAHETCGVRPAEVEEWTHRWARSRKPRGSALTYPIWISLPLLQE